MGVYYDFYLDKKIDGDKWSSLLYNNDYCIYYVRSYGNWFLDEYRSGREIGFEGLSEEYKTKNREHYEKVKATWEARCYVFEEMDLDRIMSDYKNELHDYAGIISKHAYKKLQSDPEYEPKIIEEEVYAKFKDNIKEHYVYHEWDSYLGESYYLYELMPIVEQLLKENNLSLDDVRLLCHVG